MKELVKKIIPQRFKAGLKQMIWGSDLCELASIYGTDKWGIHRYAQHYQTHFSPLRRQELNILEIGVGGHDAADKGGASLRMWKEYFPKAQIFAIDIFDKSALQQDRISIFQGSQNDPVFLNSVAKRIGRIDIVIDDGSHINEHVLTSFNVLFPLVSRDGIYVIEDIQTAYWEEFGGSEDPVADNISTSIPKKLIDALNWEEFRRNPPSIGKDIIALHCYHNIIFVKKGDNFEGSNKHFGHKVHN